MNNQADGVGPPDEYEGSPMQKFMNTPLAQSQVRVAVLIVFERGIDKDDVENISLNTIPFVESVTIREFDPELGGDPVIYFP